MDSIYFMFADIYSTNSTRYFKEDLGNLTDFRKDDKHYIPILDPRKSTNYTKDLSYFRSPEEPHLLSEMDFDHLIFNEDRTICNFNINKIRQYVKNYAMACRTRIIRYTRGSPLSQDAGSADQKLKRVYLGGDINNTHIMRAFHITVRDKNGTVINDEYGPSSGPFPDSRTSPGKLIWYRPHDNMDPGYTIEEELDPEYIMPRPPLFKIDYYDDKRAVYFQRIKKSIFLPRCIKETLVTHLLLQHDWIRCFGDD